jgi:tetratricopeptide (TPR) repeat protein
VELLSEQAILLVQQAKLDTALEKAERALLLAMKLQNDPFHLGLAHLTVGRVHARRSEYATSRGHLEQGLAQARRTDMPAFEGEILRDLAAVLLDMDERELGVSYLQQSLAIMRKLGNRSQVQSIVHTLGVNFVEELDYVSGRLYLEESLQLSQVTGNQTLEARIQNATGFVYAALGDFEIALSYHERSRQISYEIGDPFQKSHACHNLCTVNRKLGRLEIAEQWGREALLLAQQNNLADPDAFAWLHLGYVLRDRGKLLQAAEAFTHSREGWLTLGRKSLEIEALAGLAGVHLKLNDLPKALSLVEQVVEFLAQHRLEGVDEPIQVFLTCYHVLRRCDDGRADDLLQQAHTQVMTIAAKISDPTIRSAFLERVPAHHELIRLWKAREA